MQIERHERRGDWPCQPPLPFTAQAGMLTTALRERQTPPPPAALGQVHADDDLIRHRCTGGLRLEVVDVLAVDVHGDAAARLPDVGIRNAVGEIDLGGHLHNLVLAIHFDSSNTAVPLSSSISRRDYPDGRAAMPLAMANRQHPRFQNVEICNVLPARGSF